MTLLINNLNNRGVYISNKILGIIYDCIINLIKNNINKKVFNNIGICEYIISAMNIYCIELELLQNLCILTGYLITNCEENLNRFSNIGLCENLIHILNANTTNSKFIQLVCFNINLLLSVSTNIKRFHDIGCMSILKIIINNHKLKIDDRKAAQNIYNKISSYSPSKIFF
jgi:hypothetical protein